MKSTDAPPQTAPLGALSAIHQRTPSREELLDLAAERIREAASLATLELTLKVGEIVIEHLYRGSFDAWRKRGKKCHSLRKLATRQDLPMSATAIYRSVALYELVIRLGGTDNYSSLGVSHYRAVLTLEPSLQKALLSDANAQNWSAAELEKRVRELTSDHGRERGGRRPLHPVHLAVRKATRSLSVPVAPGAILGDPERELVRRDLLELVTRLNDLAHAIGLDSIGSLPASAPAQNSADGHLRAEDGVYGTSPRSRPPSCVTTEQ